MTTQRVAHLWILLTLGVVLHAAVKAKESNATLDPSTVQMLSNILDSLDAFRNDRLKDLEKLRFNNVSSPVATNASVVTPSVSENIKALRDGIMGHHPVKKTFGYKVTVYTSPIEEGGKANPPVLVTQYVGGDMKPQVSQPSPRQDEDLDQSANDPRSQLIFSSGSAPVYTKVTSGGEKSGGLDHSRKTEQHAILEGGHKRGQKESSQLEKGHDREAHSDKHGEHHKESDSESHRHDEHSHDKGGASQQGIREKTEIEYYEREHFLDTEYDKAKGGHEKTSGVKEHQSQSDHDTHDLKRLHSKSDSHSHAQEHGDQLRPSHYSPPYGGHAVAAKALEDKQRDEGSSTLLQKEESSGNRGHKSQKDHEEHQDDKGYHDKDKGRRKEGYRERGYKITAEREYFLNDAHHDTGHGAHTSGQKSREKESETHGDKAGERDRGFVKENKSQESHDAAYDKKERHFEDEEKKAEGFSEAKAQHSPGVVYMEEPVLHHVQHRPDLLPQYTHSEEEEAYKPVDYDEDTSRGYQGHASYKNRPPNPRVVQIRDIVQNAALREPYIDIKAPPPTYQSNSNEPLAAQQQQPPREEAVHFPRESNDRANRPYRGHSNKQSPLVQYENPIRPLRQIPQAYPTKSSENDNRQVIYHNPVYGPTAYGNGYDPRTSERNPDPRRPYNPHQNQNVPLSRPSADKNSFSPVVLLSRGPPTDKALDVWYTRQQLQQQQQQRQQ